MLSVNVIPVKKFSIFFYSCSYYIILGAGFDFSYFISFLLGAKKVYKEIFIASIFDMCS